MTALELSDLLDSLGAGDLYLATMMGTDGSLAVEWVTQDRTTYTPAQAMSDARMTALIMDAIADIRCAVGTPTSAVKKSTRQDDDTEPMFSIAGNSGILPSMWPAPGEQESDSLEIDFDLVRQDASECREKYCRKCGTECGWIEMITSKFWGCPKC